MKVLLAILALYAPQAMAAPDYYGMCKTQLSAVADQLSSYYGAQSSECQSALDQPASGRQNQQIKQSCQNANGQLLPLKNRAYAICAQCRRLGDARINGACTDNGVSAFISAVGQL